MKVEQINTGMTYPSKNVTTHYSTMPTNIGRNKARIMALLGRARRAVAWGIPDRESTGYTQVELCTIIKDLIKELEKTIPD